LNEIKGQRFSSPNDSFENQHFIANISKSTFGTGLFRGSAGVEQTGQYRVAMLTNYFSGYKS